MAPVLVPVVTAMNRPPSGGAEADLLALHVAEAGLVDAGREERVADVLDGSSRRPTPTSRMTAIAAKIVQPWRWLPAYWPNV